MAGSTSTPSGTKLDKSQFQRVLLHDDAYKALSSSWIPILRKLMALVLVLYAFLLGNECSSLLTKWQRSNHANISSWQTEVYPLSSSQSLWCNGPRTASFHDDDLPTCPVVSQHSLKNHLLVDIMHFQDDSVYCQQGLLAMMSTILAMLDERLDSYTCEEMQRAFTCIGTAETSQIALAAWPKHNYLAMDLFTFGAISPVSVISKLEERVFSATINGAIYLPEIKWAQKTRGDFSEGVDRTFSEAGVGKLHVKKRLVKSVESDYQHIHVWETERESQDFDRIVFLDDTSQSRKFGEAAYHEGLVHPALLSHGFPRRVAIIGGGEGATLREVLKHKTVEKVLMIEIDEVMVETSRMYLPDWNYCGNLENSSESCFDDYRVEIIYADAMMWFMNKFRSREKVELHSLFDVVIMDALDPSTVVEFSDVMYKSDDLVVSVYNSLSTSGVLCIQIGQSPTIDDPPKTHLRDSQLLSLFENIQAVGFQSIMQYDEIHGGFEAPWTFLAVMRDNQTRVPWLRGQAAIDLDIRKRAVRTRNNESPLRYFDGATMMTWKFPARTHEETWCRANSPPRVCELRNFNQDESNAARSRILGGVNRNFSDAQARLDIGFEVQIAAALSEIKILQVWNPLRHLLSVADPCPVEWNEEEGTRNLLYNPCKDRHYPHCHA